MPRSPSTAAAYDHPVCADAEPGVRRQPYVLPEDVTVESMGVRYIATDPTSWLWYFGYSPSDAKFNLARILKDAQRHP